MGLRAATATRGIMAAFVAGLAALRDDMGPASLPAPYRLQG
jgi:hypothetical protein